jgi:integrase/recombinase XerD
MDTNITRLLEEYRHSLENEGILSASRRAYLTDLHLFIGWFEKTTGEAFDPSSVVRRDLLEWRAEKLIIAKPSSVNRSLSSLRSFFSWAQRKGLVSLDPTNRLHGVKVPADNLLPRSDDEIDLILQQARLSGNQRDRALLELLAATGMRVLELAALKGEDLELGTSSARVLVRPKGAHLQRWVPVNVRARVALREYQAARSPTGPHMPLFVCRSGKAISSFAIWYAVKKYARLAGLNNISPRTFRNALARRLVNDPQVGLVNAARQLGHRQLDKLAHFISNAETV